MKVGRHTSRGSSGSTWRVGALAACIVLMAVALAGCGWVTFRYNPAHTGYNGTENTIGLGNVASLTPLWSATTGGAVNSSPAVQPDAVRRFHGREPARVRPLRRDELQWRPEDV